MTRRPAGALAGIAMILLLALPAGAGAAGTVFADALRVPRLEPPLDDVVPGEPAAGAARIAASSSSQRYPIDDGSGATIAVDITSACAANCTADDPQQIADFIGTLIHGPEVGLLTVQLDTPFQIVFDCGLGAEACYYSGEDKIVLNGNEEMSSDGAGRDFVLAHEYGHHVAQHRHLPAPFGGAVDWGTERWASRENVCQGRRRGRLYPGDEGSHYFEDPGEAFAEAFARYSFPQDPIRWRYSAGLRPTPASFQAIQEDTLSPWRQRTSFVLSGHVPARGEGAAVEILKTPLDGTVSLRPSLRRRGYELALRSRAGRLLRRSHHALGPRNRLDYTVCGESRLRLVITSTRRHRTPFKLQVQRP
ncbi:MAG: ImmA/IrrE family metallo-endopeptidase [Solirubrobacterales bacterium]